MHSDVVNRGRCFWRTNLRDLLYVSFILLQFATVSFSQCITGAYLATLSDGSKDCKLCQICPTNYREVRKCASNHDTSCCPPWTYTPLSSTKCKTCTICSPGFYVKQSCKADSDTICEPCPHQTFTNRNDSSSCIGCKDCESKIPCTSVSDTVCKEDSTTRLKIIAAVVAVLIVVASVIVFSLIIYRRKHKEQHQTHSRFAQESSENKANNTGEQLELTSVPIEVDNSRTDAIKPKGQEEYDKNKTDTKYNKNDFSNERKRTNKGVLTPGRSPEQTIGTTSPTIEIKIENKLYSEKDELPQCVLSSIGVMVDSYTEEKWVVSRVGTNFALTVSDAYDKIQGERNGTDGENEEAAKGVHVHFIYDGKPTSFRFKKTPSYINRELHVMVLEIIDLFNLPTFLQLNTKRMKGKDGNVNVIDCSWVNPPQHTITKTSQLEEEMLTKIKRNIGKTQIEFENYVFLKCNDASVNIGTGSPGFQSIETDTVSVDFIYTNASLNNLESMHGGEKQGLLEENKFNVCTSLHAVYNDMKKTQPKLAQNLFCPKY